MPRFGIDSARRFAVASLLLSVALVALVGAVQLAFLDVRAGWADFNASAMAEQSRLRSLREALGYGGFIHHFKNFVLRREQFYYLESGLKLDAAEAALRGMRGEPLDANDAAQLAAIEATVAAYRNQWRQAGAPAMRVLPAAELDAAVRVSDQGALAALSALSADLDNQRAAGFAHFESRLTHLGWLTAATVVFAIGFAVLGWWLNRLHGSLHAHAAELKRAIAAKDEAEGAKRRFMANISHEIRTPLNAIVNLSQLGLRQQPPERLRHYLETISRSSETVLGMVNDILDFSKIEARKLTLEATTIDLEALAESAAQRASLLLNGKPVEVVLALDPALPRFVVGDPVRLDQVLSNLLSNAVKFTERGEIRLEAGVEAVAAGGRTTLRFRVADSGIGIAPADLERLFKPFVQADESVTRRYGGSGLGLAICKELVELMGGSIDVRSRPGQGSTFSFALTFEPAADVPRPRIPAQLAGLRALLVEDSYAWRTLLADMLGRMGLEVQAVGSAPEASARFEAGLAERRPFDLLIVDWGLQDGNAMALLQALLQSRPEQERSQIIVLSSYDSAPVRRELEPLGVQQVLSKPISSSRLLDALTRAVDGGQAGRQAAHEHEPPPAVLGALRGRRVLLVEDNEVNRFVSCEMLAQLGVDVDTAEDGRIAVDKCLHGAYDVVLMDVQMPHMDGLSATRLIRQRLGEHAPPIIAMTAGASAQERQACADAGMDGYLSKPVRMGELAACLQSFGAPPGASNPARTAP